MQDKAEKQLYRLSRRGFVGGAARCRGGSCNRGQRPRRTRSSRGHSLVTRTARPSSSPRSAKRRTINPFLTNESEGDWRCLMLFDRFVGIDPVGLLPNETGLSSGWTLDDLAYTFTLR